MNTDDSFTKSTKSLLESKNGYMRKHILKMRQIPKLTWISPTNQSVMCFYRGDLLLSTCTCIKKYRALIRDVSMKEFTKYIRYNIAIFKMRAQVKPNINR